MPEDEIEKKGRAQEFASHFLSWRHGETYATTESVFVRAATSSLRPRARRVLRLPATKLRSVCSNPPAQKRGRNAFGGPLEPRPPECYVSFTSNHGAQRKKIPQMPKESGRKHAIQQ